MLGARITNTHGLGVELLIQVYRVWLQRNEIPSGLKKEAVEVTGILITQGMLVQKPIRLFCYGSNPTFCIFFSRM